MLLRREQAGGWAAAVGVLAIVLGGSAACRHRAIEATHSSIEMKRFPSMGLGQEYVVSLYPDGRMVYYGQSETKHHSWWRAKFDPNRFRTLMAFLEEKGYASWRSPQNQLVDAGLTDLSIVGPAGPNLVREGEANLPAGMFEAEKRIDEIIVGATDWQQISKGTPPANLLEPPLDTWLERDRLSRGAMRKAHS